MYLIFLTNEKPENSWCIWLTMGEDCSGTVCSCQETISSVTTTATTTQCDSDHVIRSTEATICPKTDQYQFITINLEEKLIMSGNN